MADADREGWPTVPLPVVKVQAGAVALNYRGLVIRIRKGTIRAAITVEEGRLEIFWAETEDMEVMEEEGIGVVIREEGIPIPREAVFLNLVVCLSLL